MISSCHAADNHVFTAPLSISFGGATLSTAKSSAIPCWEFMAAIVSGWGWQDQVPRPFGHLEICGQLCKWEDIRSKFDFPIFHSKGGLVGLGMFMKKILCFFGGKKDG
ncbi:hypothetical protein CDAR_27651 [Caerostris darwini]|uniref:Uncharacterized protein n=1 Tax=Caerostris darwini TaxID=1538125 RepID=A0AAV4SR12_9ARAC|nr:hypothetical protein CDAR_27651 [Caerostris darwini]